MPVHGACPCRAPSSRGSSRCTFCSTAPPTSRSRGSSSRSALSSRRPSAPETSRSWRGGWTANVPVVSSRPQGHWKHEGVGHPSQAPPRPAGGVPRGPEVRERARRRALDGRRPVPGLPRGQVGGRPARQGMHGGGVRRGVRPGRGAPDARAAAHLALRDARGPALDARSNSAARECATRALRPPVRTRSAHLRSQPSRHREGAGGWRTPNARRARRRPREGEDRRGPGAAQEHLARRGARGPDSAADPCVADITPTRSSKSGCHEPHRHLAATTRSRSSPAASS